jgi:hypothetical protein
MFEERQEPQWCHQNIRPCEVRKEAEKYVKSARIKKIYIFLPPDCAINVK